MPGTGNEGETVTCNDARALILDGLTRELQPPEVRALDGHVAVCELCRIASEDLRALWSDLGKLSAPAPRPDARARFHRALAGATATEPVREAGLPSRHARIWRWSAIAAAVLVAAILGYARGTATRGQEAPRAAASAAPRGGTYLLLLHVRTAAGAATRPADEARIVAEYSRWARGLSAAGKLVVAEKLADRPAEMLGAGAPPDDGDRIGGFFLIRAASFEEAQRIANDCPHLQYGGRVELRAIEPT